MREQIEQLLGEYTKQGWTFHVAQNPGGVGLLAERGNAEYFHQLLHSQADVSDEDVDRLKNFLRTLEG